MINKEEAEEIICKFIDLRNKYNASGKKSDKILFEKHEAHCIQKFEYLISMRTNKYKGFSNYEDLHQEGMVALVKAMKNYNPKLGSFFWWAHKYIDTRIARSANLHTTIRFPLKYAKENTPHKESVLPSLVDGANCPEKDLEEVELSACIEVAMNKLTDEQKAVMQLAYGFTGDKALSINKICKKLNISRVVCVRTINNALSSLKENIKM